MTTPLNSETITGITSGSSEPIELGTIDSRIILHTELKSQNNVDSQAAIEMIMQCGESGQILTVGVNFQQTPLKDTSIDSTSDMYIPCDERIYLYWNPSTGGGEVFYSITYTHSTTTEDMNINILNDPTRNTFFVFVTMLFVIYFVLWYMNLKPKGGDYK